MCRALASHWCRCYTKLCIIKPFTSCAAEGEHFAVLTDYVGIEAAGPVIQYLEALAAKLAEVEGTPGGERYLADALPPPAWITDEFYAYVARRTNRMVRRQVTVLQAIRDNGEELRRQAPVAREERLKAAKARLTGAPAAARVAAEVRRDPAPEENAAKQFAHLKNSFDDRGILKSRRR